MTAPKTNRSRPPVAGNPSKSPTRPRKRLQSPSSRPRKGSRPMKNVAAAQPRRNSHGSPLTDRKSCPAIVSGYAPEIALVAGGRRKGGARRGLGGRE